MDLTLYPSEFIEGFYKGLLLGLPAFFLSYGIGQAARLVKYITK